MADQNFREIQVSAKQLVFLFMASVVLAVAVFLLGVSVGRGVREKTTPAGLSAAEPAAFPPVTVAAGDPLPGPTELPPKMKFGDLSDVGGKAGAAEPAKTPDAPKVAAPPAQEAPDVNEPDGGTSAKVSPPAKPDKPAPAPKPAPVAAKAAELPAPPKPGSGWSIQVNSFRSRENADRQVSDLRAKGYSNGFVVPAPPGGLFRVRVGPYSQRSDADRAAAKLRQEGFNPSVTR